jgi:twitching motility protein PilT
MLNTNNIQENWSELIHFLDHAKDNLLTIEQGLLNLESSSTQEQMVIVKKIFYATYSLRDGTNIFACDDLQTIIYGLENALAIMQKYSIIYDKKLVSLLLKILDVIFIFIESIEEPSDYMQNKVWEARQVAEVNLNELKEYLQHKQKLENFEDYLNVQSSQNKCQEINLNLQQEKSMQTDFIDNKSSKIQVSHQSENRKKTTESNLKSITSKLPVPPSSLRNYQNIITTSKQKYSFSFLIQSQPNLDNLLKFALDKNFTDIYLGRGENPRFKNYLHQLITKEYQLIDDQILNSWLDRILTKKQLNTLKTKQEVCGSLEYKNLDIRIRFQVFNSYQGIAINLHLIPLKIPTIEDLSLPLVLQDLSNCHKGLILISGEAASGKSTTAAAMVNYINHNYHKYIITIENPIEFVYTNRKGLVKQIQIDEHFPNYHLALITAIKQNPHVLFIDCLEDADTLNMALKAVSRGCLVIATCYGSTVRETFTDIINFYAPENNHKIRVRLAQSLLAIVTQGLCPTVDGQQTAYHDIWIKTELTKNYLLEGKFAEMLPIMEDGELDGMITMNKSLLNLYQQGKIEAETAVEKAPSPDYIYCGLQGQI